MELAAKCLTRGHHVPLHAAGERGAHLAEVVRVLAVGLLRPAPRGVAEGVHAHAAVEVGAHRPQLPPDGLADALLEVEVPRGATRHGDGEGGGVADDDATRAVAEGEARDAEAIDPRGDERAAVVAAGAQVGHAGPERDVAVEAPSLLLVGHGLDEAAARPRPRRAPAPHRVHGVVPLGARIDRAWPIAVTLVRAQRRRRPRAPRRLPSRVRRRRGRGHVRAAGRAGRSGGGARRAAGGRDRRRRRRRGDHGGGRRARCAPPRGAGGSRRADHRLRVRRATGARHRTARADRRTPSTSRR